MSKYVKYVTAAEAAARVRAAYKARGWGAKDVSVRCRGFAGGDEVRVEVKSPRVRFAAAREVAMREQDVARDELTGEILSGGGNRYVDVQHSDEAQEVLARRHLGAVEAALARLDADDLDGAIERVDGCDALVGRGQWPAVFQLWRADESPQTFNRDSRGLLLAAYELALRDGDQR